VSSVSSNLIKESVSVPVEVMASPASAAAERISRRLSGPESPMPILPLIPSITNVEEAPSLSIVQKLSVISMVEEDVGSAIWSNVVEPACMVSQEEPLYTISWLPLVSHAR